MAGVQHTPGIAAAPVATGDDLHSFNAAAGEKFFG
jgi:hypothetical protein